MRIKTSYIYIYGAISHNVHYEKGCSVSPYMPYHMSEKGVPHYGKASSTPSNGLFRPTEKAVRQHERAFSAPRTAADGTSEWLKRMRKRLFRVPRRNFPRNAVSISQICFVVFFYHENVYLCVL